MVRCRIDYKSSRNRNIPNAAVCHTRNTARCSFAYIVLSDGKENRLWGRHGTDAFRVHGGNQNGIFGILHWIIFAVAVRSWAFNCQESR